MALIDKSLANDLHTLRDIRNAFAHPKEELNFSSKRIVELIRNFSGYEGGIDGHLFFVTKSGELVHALQHSCP